jgi:hypothetical protein
VEGTARADSDRRAPDQVIPTGASDPFLVEIFASR